MTTMENAKTRVTDQLNAAAESMEHNVRQARRAVTRGQYAAEDLADATALEVRRRPLASVGLAAAAGAFLGCLVGYASGRASRR